MISAFVVAGFGAVVCGSMTYLAMAGTLPWIAAGVTFVLLTKHER